MTSAESVDGSAMMTSAVMSSQSAVSYSTTSRWYLKLAIAKRCRLDKWIRQRFAFALRFSRWILRWKNQQSLGNPVASISRPTTGQPAASTSRRNQQYIQTRATIDQLLICIQSQDDVPVASTSKSTSGQPVAAMKRKTRCEVNFKGATTRRRKETAVARSVVTKKRQQLSEQLLNNLLENIQLLDAINAQDGRING
ncbi:glycerol-3-phosphate acyltransferase 1-like [Dorcoceras hygrometricum]|uniref:Glycerol-3-phosphate acyltransferase 1-like n=1 Tax=Dorcoceras hygrometricum TaxID=472368 RepID=A0A2Z7AHY1_9LAMI|nr:glycerol-3-phosphate acyltransferase 1-like [Dorcoceras hygrometricum]